MEDASVPSRCRVRRTDKAADPDRFYCPFPKCNRSFIDLWRLKVHYRAAPDVRGSGRERGHGLELPACPKCGKVLERGRHHVNCAAGKAAPSQALRRADRGLTHESLKRKSGDEPLEGDVDAKAVRLNGNVVRKLQIPLDACPADTHSLASPYLSPMGVQSPSGACGDSVQNFQAGQDRVSSRMDSRHRTLKIIPVETPLLDGQMDSRDSMFSSDTYAGLSPIPVPISPAGTPTTTPAAVLSPSTVPSPSNFNLVATPAQSITPNGPGPLDLADCQVTPGYAVFVGGAEYQYDVFFVPGSSQSCVENLPVCLEQPNPEKAE
ncbi:hypothetical protein BSKO_01688 [Bryopsis sp. KO-2023]|nr:hypothetical protein BSKO_01688 [Bryopsis sp. KO-2023]